MRIGGFVDCPDSCYGRRWRYFSSGSDARRCPAGGVVAKAKKTIKLGFCVIVFVGVVFMSSERTERNHDTMKVFT